MRVDRHHVVERDELVAEGAGSLDAAEQRVADLGAFEVRRVENASSYPSSWSMIELKPMASAPELSIRSGGLPPMKRGCSSVAILVEGDTFTVTFGWFFCMRSAANSHVVDAVAAVEDHRVDGRAVGDAERIGRVLRERTLVEPSSPPSGTAAAAAAVPRMNVRRSIVLDTHFGPSLLFF